MLVSAGKLDRQITIESKSVTPDPVYGSEVVTWVPLSTVGSPPVAERYWAEVQDVLPSRDEALRNGLVASCNRTRIRIRYRSDIDSSMRITVHGETDVIYQIVGGPAIIAGRKTLIELFCEKYSS